MENMDKVNILTQFVRRLAVINPGILSIMSGEDGEPRVSVDIQVKAGQIDQEGQIYEVITLIQVEAKKEDNTIFKVELDYSGVVRIESGTDEEIEKLVLVSVPVYLFPFARNIVSDATRDCGYPPVYLSPVDFEELFEKKKKAS